MSDNRLYSGVSLAQSTATQTVPVLLVNSSSAGVASLTSPTIVASKNQKKPEKTSESDTDNDQNKTILMKFLMGELEIFKVEKINPAYKGGMVNYQGYTIDLDEARKHNLSKDRPAHYKLPYTQEEIDAVQAAHKSGNRMVELQSYFQRRESILEKILNDLGEKKYFALEAGTGVGKSAVGLTVARKLLEGKPPEGFEKGAIFVTTQKIL